MTRSTAFIAVFLGVCACAGCDNSSQPPTSPNLPTSPAAPTPPPSPPPPPTPPSPPDGDQLVGSYTLTIDARSNCTNMPHAPVMRRYDATISFRGGTNYLVTLDTGKFLTGVVCTGGSVDGIGCEQFLASRNGDTVRFDLDYSNDTGWGGQIVEHLEDGSWMQLLGSSTGPVREGTIEARGSGSLSYCATPRSDPYPGFYCPEALRCSPDDLKLTFTRK